MGRITARAIRADELRPELLSPLLPDARILGVAELDAVETGVVLDGVTVTGDCVDVSVTTVGPRVLPLEVGVTTTVDETTTGVAEVVEGVTITVEVGGIDVTDTVVEGVVEGVVLRLGVVVTAGVVVITAVVEIRAVVKLVKLGATEQLASPPSA